MSETIAECDWFNLAYAFPKEAGVVARCIGSQRRKPGAAEAIRVLAKQYDPSCVFTCVVSRQMRRNNKQTKAPVDWYAASWMVNECGFDATALLTHWLQSDGTQSVSTDHLLWFRDVVHVRLSERAKRFCDDIVKYDRRQEYITEAQCAKYLKLFDTMVDDADPDPTDQGDRSRHDVRPKYAFQGPLVTYPGGQNVDIVSSVSYEFFVRHGLDAPDFLRRRE